jgi:hypothetical protein
MGPGPSWPGSGGGDEARKGPNTHALMSRFRGKKGLLTCGDAYFAGSF